MYVKFYKRVIDLVLSIIGLSLLFPVLVVVGSVIFLADGNPIFFKQRRVGKNRIQFQIFKFRTMSFKDGSDLGTFDSGDCSRVTELGQLLRKYKIDELPQLFNVIKGDMSIVGPRPEIEKYTKIFTEEWDLILKVKPGITDWASLRFRNEEYLLKNKSNPGEAYETVVLPVKLRYYRKYVEEISFSKDIEIMIRTLLTVFWRQDV